MSWPGASDLAAAWTALRGEPRDARAFRARRLVVDGMAEVFAALRNEDDALALMFRLDAAVAPSARYSFRTDGIEYVRSDDVSPREVLVGVVLEPHQPSDLFGVLASDLVRQVSSGTIAGAGSRLAERLQQWRNALRARRGELSREDVVGLVGELAILRALAGLMPTSSAVDAWKGPEDGLHDFLANGIGVEVKATAGANPLIPISSLDQLESTGLRRLVLARPRFVEDPNGASLPAMVTDARSCVGGGELERKLALAGWRDQDLTQYEAYRFRHVGTDFYEVAEDFPALTRAMCPSGVADVHYRIDPRSLAGFRRDGPVLGDLAAQMMEGQDGS